MDRRHHVTPSKELFLRVPLVQHQLRQQIAPVILEQRCFMMFDQSGKVHTSTSSTTTATTTTSTSTLATTTSMTSSSERQAAVTKTATTTSSSTQRSVTGTTATSSTQRSVTATTTITEIDKPPPPKSPTTLRSTKGGDIIPPSSRTPPAATQTSPLLSLSIARTAASSSSTTLTAASFSSPAVKASTASTVPAPSIVTTTAATADASSTATAGDGDSASTDIVGRKHPHYEEEGPQRVLSSPSPRVEGDDDDDDRGTKQNKQQLQHLQPSDTLVETERSRNRKQLQQPATTTSKLSTREQTQSKDQQPYRERSHSEGRPSVQFTLVPIKRDEAHVMEFFQEQEKNLQESFLSLPKSTPKKQRSPSPRAQHNVGMEHLDSLVKLMQQLTSLKDENVRLRKRCDFLESTKVLLEAKRELSPEGDDYYSPSGVMTLQAKQKHHKPHHHHHYHHQQHHHHHQRMATKSRQSTTFPADMRGGARPRLSSAEEFQLLEAATSSSDPRSKPAKKAMHKRSFSTGSLGVPPEILLDGVAMVTAEEKSSKSKGHGIKHSSKQKAKSSKWARVKKVLTGQKLYEDLGTTIRSLREFGRSSQVRYSTTGTSSTVSDVTSALTHQSSPDMSSHGTSYELETTTKGAASMSKTSTEPSTAEGSDTELTTDIWMGPPDWWQEYEASRESGGTSLSSDVSSVIEVTTMYLSAKKDVMTTSQTTTISATSATSATSSFDTESTSQERQLQVERRLIRRRSSPSLSLQDAEDDKSLLEGCATKTEPMRFLHKSSSCKSADLDIPKEISLFGTKGGEEQESKKSHRTAWDRVKDIIIHNRKDSMKRKSRKDKLGLLTEPEESSEIDMEAFLDDQWGTDLFAEGLLSRSTPKTSPMVPRQHQQYSLSKSIESGAMSKSGPCPGSFPSGPSGTIDISALLGRSMSDDFNKKMQQWEEMKTRKSTSFRASIEESDASSFDVSQSSQDFPLPVRAIDLRDLGGAIQEATSESLTIEDSNTSTETHGGQHAHHVEGMQKKMTDSFSRKMLEWEKRKYKGSPVPIRDSSPDMERKGSKGRKEERQKSKRSREDKEKEKMERQREREMQKVEREQVKLEKEKLRIEKERLRALEREAKLEKLKGRLSQSDTDYRDPILSPLAEYKVTADFARKLHEWELRKGLSHDMSNSMYLEAQKMKLHQTREETASDSSRQRSSPRFTYDRVGEEGAEGGDKSPPSPFPLQPFWDSPDNTSPLEKCSDASQGDETSMSEECRTTANIPSLERANAQLLHELRKKEAEYSAVQNEVHTLNTRLAKVRNEHASEMARYHRDLALGTPAEPVKLEVGELEQSMVDLEDKIKLMENFGNKLADSMESAAVGKWQSIEGEETVHTQLVDLVGQMRTMLVQATQSEEASQKSSALSNFETLYSQAMKLQVEMNNLRLSHLERNREIMVIKRQLLLQEVNNLVLQADITRRETELYQFQESKRSSIKKWNTFSGKDRYRPQAQIELPVPIVVKTQPKSSQAKVSIKDNSVELVSERIPIPTTTKSAPSSPLAKFTDDDVGMSTSCPVSSGQSHSEVARPPDDQSTTDHRERLTSTSILAKRRVDVQSSQFEADETNEETIRTTSSSGTRTRQREPAAQSILSLRLPTAVVTLPAGISQTSRVSLSPVLSKRQTDPSQDSQVVDKEEGEKQEEGSHKETISSKAVQGIPERVVMMSYDSEPLHRELEALRIARGRVGKGSPTLIAERRSRQVPTPVPSPGLGPGGQSGNTLPETPDKSIPKQPLRVMGRPRLQRVAPLMDVNISQPTAQSVIECTDPSNPSDHTQPTTTTTSTTIATTAVTATTPQGLVGADVIPSSSSSQAATSPTSTSVPLSTLPPISDQARAGSRSPRSPVAKQKLLRRQQKDERDTKHKEYTAISPKGSPVATRGKPPLPRQGTPIRQSPSSSPSVSEKGMRSKSHGDVDTVVPTSPTIKALQDTINKFEKRATVCETEDRPIELRKTPSPTLHLPRVGLVSRVRKLKPAAELLEESQRYRSGQSIYATRILQKYLPKEEAKSDSPQKTSHNKENVSGDFVHSIVQRLSRETTPVRSGASSATNSNGSLHWHDPPRPPSELVSNLVRKLSSSSGPDNKPFSDRTNGGQGQLKKEPGVKYDDDADYPKTVTLPSEREITDQTVQRHARSSAATVSATASKLQHRKSCEVAQVLSSTTSPITESSFQLVSSSLSTGSVAASGDRGFLTDVTPSPTNHKSLPSLPSPTRKVFSLSSIDTEQMRARSATYNVSMKEKLGRSEGDGSFDMEPEFSSQTSGSSVFSKSVEKEHELDDRVQQKDKGEEISSKSKKEGRRMPSSLSPIRRGADKRKMDTVGVLCKQSISFDLGVSTSARDQTAPSIPRKPRSWDPSDSVAMEAARVVITAATTGSTTTTTTSSVGARSSIEIPDTGDSGGAGAEGGGEIVSPPSSPTSKEKKRSRRFLDANWLQRSKRFFKVHK